MLSSVPVCIAVGTVLGFLSGLGVGGGSLLMLWLTAVCGTAQRTARGINLLFFLPAAAVSLFFHRRQGRLNLHIAVPAAIAGSLTAALCAWAGTSLDDTLLRKLFGGLMLVIGAKELLGKQHGPGER